MNCRVISCERAHADDQVCCRPHWFSLPKPVREEIWRLYRVEAGSAAHVDAVHSALDWLNDRHRANEAGR